MFVCPTCGNEFNTSEQIAKHSLICWHQHNPYHKPKPAPREPDIVTTEINEDALNFFSSFQKGSQNA